MVLIIVEGSVMTIVVTVRVVLVNMVVVMSLGARECATGSILVLSESRYAE